MIISRRPVLKALAALATLPGSAAFAATTRWQASALEQELGCPVLTQESGIRYQIATELWNGWWKKKPAFIAKCGNATDVSRCVDYARRTNTPLSVKSCGHHPAGFALRDGGMTIDLSEMMNIDVDPVGKRVVVQPGVRIGHLQMVLEPYKLCAVGPMTSTVGVAGMMMGGGYGWFSGEAGFAVDNLISAEVVTSDGKIRKVDAQNNPDLFWAIRGGGGNFGVITSLEFRVHDLPPLTGGVIVYAGADVEAAARGWARYTEDPELPPELFSNLVILPPPPGVPAPVVLFMSKSALQGKANDMVLERLRSFGQPVQDTMRPVSLTEMQGMADLDGEAGYSYAVNTHFFSHLPDEAIGIMLKAMANAPSPHAIMLWGPQHGAMRKPGPTDTAYYHRDAKVNGFVLSRWTDPAEAEKNIEWVRRVWNDLKPYSTGQVMMSFTSETDPELGEICFGDNYERLSRIKHQYDPSNMFSSTVNIRPRA